MARPKLSRLIKKAPNVAGFEPYGNACISAEPVLLQFDEYEAIRLLDYEGMQQVEAANVMNISRPTLTRIYNSARQAISKALVEGRPISMTGGNIDFENYQQLKANITIMNQKIAIPTIDGKLCAHFGKAPQITMATVVDGKITETEVLDSPEHIHGSLPKFIASHSCTNVICGGLGQGAIDKLNEYNIQVHKGAPTIEVEELLTQYLNGSIIYKDGGCPGGHHHHHHGTGHGGHRHCHGKGKEHHKQD